MHHHFAELRAIFQSLNLPSSHSWSSLKSVKLFANCGITGHKQAWQNLTYKLQIKGFLGPDTDKKRNISCS